ncbi:tRNA (adenosine(37)-N6)-threonylcarbamoyltransferase complex dimerization subunit type 1 TsaB [Candidatus Hoaglandella endobia]|uniref:tRNA threonylcarbamoyladenosine biosynthesis protein TsaB n=1 Tax=Candidatus Hoaglandella endobia TaxID=1778263 RepID=A0A143WU64_9ENTR|nr:tRNA (adenosine(37)-N6)-threonylcarbamoyltransferase complex dimerization subunit type 1 TsaB [Candidatus Hoaglandella endobia]CUX97399.1 tRNA threonylcarbamoyladenosine biosynthesis protein TsaB [Candidatus Hoaglandella endobia]
MSTRILAIDTATEACSAALMEDCLLLERYVVAPREHTQRILPMVDSLLAEAGIKLKELDALAFSRGPGSFTGVRIGIGIAQGLALGADLPLIGISTLATVAEGAWRQTGVSQILTAINAHMGKVYWAQYQRQAEGKWLGEESETIATPAVLAVLNAHITGCWATAGTGWQIYPTLMSSDNRLQLIPGHTLLPSARDILPLALYLFCRGGAQQAALVQPNYLHNDVMWKKLPGRG